VQVLVTYDVATEKDDGKNDYGKLRKCVDFGHAYKIIFECLVDQAQYENVYATW